MTEELKPCPFCGGKEVKLFKEGSIWVVECLQCLAKVEATAEADVVDFWNYRPKEEQLGEQIREMKQKNAALKREILEVRKDNWNARAADEVNCEPSSYSCRACKSGTDEKIEQLEAENERLKKYAEGLKKEIKSLREALTFYAEMTGNDIQLYGDMDSKALEFDDGESFPFGKRARDALKGAGK